MKPSREATLTRFDWPPKEAGELSGHPPTYAKASGALPST